MPEHFATETDTPPGTLFAPTDSPTSVSVENKELTNTGKLIIAVLAGLLGVSVFALGFVVNYYQRKVRRLKEHADEEQINFTT